LLSHFVFCYSEPSHFAKVFSHFSLLSYFPPLEIPSAIFPLLNNFLPLEILSAIFHCSRDSSTIAQSFSTARDPVSHFSTAQQFSTARDPISHFSLLTTQAL
jgi:hypothetical protein